MGSEMCIRDRKYLKIDKFRQKIKLKYSNIVLNEIAGMREVV